MTAKSKLWNLLKREIKHLVPKEFSKVFETRRDSANVTKKSLILKADQWVKDNIQRQSSNKTVFILLDKILEIAKICGI